MTDTNQNLVIYRGNTCLVHVPLTFADGTPYVPTPGVEMKWRVKRTVYSLESDSLVMKELGSGLTLVEGGVDIEIEAPDSNLVPGQYYHELKVFDAGDVDTAMIGTFHVRPATQVGSTFSPAAATITLSGSVPVPS